MIRILPSSEGDNLLARQSLRSQEAENVVRPIIEAVRQRGDAAVLEYAQEFDGLQRSPVVSSMELWDAANSLPREFRNALEQAASNVRRFAQFQMPKEQTIELAPGLIAGQIVRPLDRVACYIPSGRYPLPSTLMMTTVPAQVAGVKHICVTTPRLVSAILGTAHLLGLEKMYLLGGAHAVAAFALGTETIERADRIVGPGNIYVATAKKLLAGEAGIDMVAGPTEILMIADEGDPSWYAADMLAQAEHDTDASAILLTPSPSFASAVADEIEKQLEGLPTAEIARQAIDNHSAILMVENLEEAAEISNRFAPEHLSIPDASWLSSIHHAGSIFIGANSPEAAGDYAAGPNHTLPTSGAARLRGGLSVLDFVKIISTQQLSADALAALAETVGTIARMEGLEAHARSVEVRLRG